VDCIARILEILMVSMFKEEAIALSFYLGYIDMKDFQITGKHTQLLHGSIIYKQGQQGYKIVKYNHCTVEYI